MYQTKTTASMYRKSKTLQWRNREIYADYIAHLRNGMPVMMTYATIAHRYDLSENHVRNVIMAAAKNH
jgi:Mor family transcriptional regulator